MAYTLTQEDIDKLAAMNFDMRGVAAGTEAMAGEIEALMPDIVAGNIGSKISSDAGAPFVSQEQAQYGATKALNRAAEGDLEEIIMEPRVEPPASVPMAPMDEAPMAAPTAAPAAAASPMMGLISADMYGAPISADPFENLSKNQRMMLAFAAIKDAGTALQGGEGSAFNKTLEGFAARQDMERKRQAQVAQQRMMGQLLGGQVSGGGDIEAQIKALTQAAMFGVIDPAAASLTINQLREAQAKQTAQKAVVGGGAGALDDLSRLTDIITNTGTTTGFTGWLFSKIPFSEATAARDLAATLRSGMALGALKELKAGGATLGSVSEKELELLESAIAKLNLDLPQDRVLEQMNAIEKHYKDAIRRAYTAASDDEKVNFDSFFGGSTPEWVFSAPDTQASGSSVTSNDLSDAEKKRLGI